MVYVDDIVITGGDAQEIINLIQYLLQHFETKNLRSLRYFLGIEVARSKKEIFVLKEICT